jgi:hypothetical protein
MASPRRPNFDKMERGEFIEKANRFFPRYYSRKTVLKIYPPCHIFSKCPKISQLVENEKIIANNKLAEKIIFSKPLFMDLKFLYT